MGYQITIVENDKASNTIEVNNNQYLLELTADQNNKSIDIIESGKYTIEIGIPYILPSGFGQFISGGYGIYTYYDNNLNILTISATGLQPSGDYASAIHTHTSNQITNFNSSVSGLLPSISGSGYVISDFSNNVYTISVSGLQPSGVYASGVHYHTSSDISDFNSSVSGLLPVKNISSGSGINVTNNSGDFTVSVTGNFGLTSEQVDDRVNDLLKAGSYVNLSYDDFNNSLTIAVTGLQPSGNYSIVGHNHTSSQITDFSSSVSGLLPVKNITGGSYISVSSSSGNYTISSTGLQPSGNYSLVGHTHTSSDITNFSSSVNSLVSGVYAPLNSPAFSGIPTVPTAASGTNTAQIASTQFVRSEISNLVNSAPSTLDTLNELATALGNDPNFATTIASGLAQKSNIGHTHTYSEITNFNSGVSGLLPSVTGSGYVNTNFNNNIYSISVSGLQPSGNYSVVGHNHSSSDITNFNSSVSGLLPSVTGTGYVVSSFNNNIYSFSVTGLQPSGNYSIIGHNHNSSEITDFNSSVSGLLPITNIVSGSYINISQSGTTFTISSTGLQPSGNYSVVGHNHSSSDISDFSSAVSGLLPVKEIIAGTGIGVSSSSGTYTINSTSTLSSDTLEPDGFVNRTDSYISFDNNSRQFSIAPKSPATSYTIYNNGTKVIKNTTESITLPNSTALYFLHFDKIDNSLSYKTTGFNFYTDIPIAHIYYNADFSKAVYFGEERHGLRMDSATHKYLHNVFGTQYINGLSISNYTLSGNGSSNSDATISIGDGLIYDEDIEATITHSNTPTNPFEQVLYPIAQLPVYYKFGASGAWTDTIANDYPVKTGTTIQYNFSNGGSWSANNSDNPSNSRFIAYWICATTQENAPIISIMGQRIDSSLLQSQSNNTWSGLNLTGLPIVELRPLYRVIYETKSSFGNTPKGFLIDILDIRSHNDTITGVTQNDHGNLYGLADDDHAQYVHIDNSRNIDATHTFNNGLVSSGLIQSTSGNFDSLTVNNVDVSISGHYHISSDISDFASSVSGLLPVKQIISGSGINLSSSSGIYTISSSSSGTFNYLSVDGLLNVKAISIKDSSRILYLGSHDWGLLSNWYLDQDRTILATSLPTSADTVVIDGTTTLLTVTSGTISADTIILKDSAQIVNLTGLTIDSNIKAYNSSKITVYGYINGDITLYDTSSIDNCWGDIKGIVTLNDSSKIKNCTNGLGFYNSVNINNNASIDDSNHSFNFWGPINISYSSTNIASPKITASGSVHHNCYGPVVVAGASLDPQISTISNCIILNTLNIGATRVSDCDITGDITANFSTIQNCNIYSSNTRVSHYCELININTYNSNMLISDSSILKGSNFYEKSIITIKDNSQILPLMSYPDAVNLYSGSKLLLKNNTTSESIITINGDPSTTVEMYEVVGVNGIGQNSTINCGILKLYNNSSLNNIVLGNIQLIQLFDSVVIDQDINIYGINIEFHDLSSVGGSNITLTSDFPVSFYDSSKNMGIVNGNVIFYDYSSNLTTASIINGNATFIDNSLNEGGVSGLLLSSNPFYGIYANSIQSSSGNFDLLNINNIPVSISGHSHSSSNIIDFNSSVSGLLPSVSGSGYINSSLNNNIYTISVSGLQPSGNYSLTGHSHISNDITDFSSGVSGLLPSVTGSGYISSVFNNNLYTLSVNGLQPSGNYSIVGHTHTNSEITDFNSGVSGLLPVTNILGGTNISVVPSGTVFTVNVSGSLGLTTEEVDDRVSNLLVAGTGITLNYNDNDNILTIGTSGLQPSGNYSLTGHTHSSSDISDFNSSVSGLLPSISGSNYITSSFGSNVYTIGVTGLQPSGNYSVSGHTHTSSNITDFNSSVSGLLPVKNIIGSGNVNIVSSSGIYTVSTSGLQPSGNYSLVGHTHTASDISNFNTSVSGLLPVTNIVGGANISVVPSGSSYTIAVSSPANANLITVGGYLNVRNSGNMTTFFVNNSGIVTAGTWNGSTIGIAYGGTGATTASGVRSNIGLGNIDNTSDLNKPVSTAQALADTAIQNYSIQRSNHTGSQLASTISDFNSSVSGLLPVKNVTGSEYVNVNSSSGTYTVSVSGLQPSGNYSLSGHHHDISDLDHTYGEAFGYLRTNPNGTVYAETQLPGVWVIFSKSDYDEDYYTQGGLPDPPNVMRLPDAIRYLDEAKVNVIDLDSAVSGLLPPVTGSGFINSVFNNNTYTISVSGLQPSGNYANATHVHTSSDITNFNSSVSGLVNGIYAPLSGTLNQFASTSSSQLASIISDETGSGNLVFSNSPTFTGIPLAPTATSGTNTNQIASTAFVRNEISNLVGSAPSALDTLNELASALGNDSNFATTVTNNIATKVSKNGDTMTGALYAPSGIFTSGVTVGGISVSISGHSHTSSDITDFNSSVSGLLPVKNLSAGSGILISSSSGSYTISTDTILEVVYPVRALHFGGMLAFNNFTYDTSPTYYWNGQTGDMYLLNTINYPDTSCFVDVSQSVTKYVSDFPGRTLNYASLEVLLVDAADRIVGWGTTSSSNAAGTTNGTGGTNMTISLLSFPTGIPNGWNLGGLNTGSLSNQFSPVIPYAKIKPIFIEGSSVDSSGNKEIVSRIRSNVDVPASGSLHSSSSIKLEVSSGSGILDKSLLLNSSGLFINSTLVSTSGHTHTSSDITNFNNGVSGLLPSITGTGYVNTSFNNNIYTVSVTGVQPSGNYSLVGHTHSSSNITDFNSSVSGLLPITSVTGGTNINVSTSGTVFTVSVSGSLGLTTEEVDDRVSSLLVAGTGISISYNDNANTLTLSTIKNEIRSDFVSSTNYIGVASGGSLTSQSVWTIRKTVYSSDGSISSNTSATNVKWDDRLTTTYS